VAGRIVGSDAVVDREDEVAAGRWDRFGGAGWDCVVETASDEEENVVVMGVRTTRLGRKAS
jgi:hypothetical protein